MQIIPSLSSFLFLFSNKKCIYTELVVLIKKKITSLQSVSLFILSQILGSTLLQGSLFISKAILCLQVKSYLLMVLCLKIYLTPTPPSCHTASSFTCPINNTLLHSSLHSVVHLYKLCLSLV